MVYYAIELMSASHQNKLHIPYLNQRSGAFDVLNENRLGTILGYFLLPYEIDSKFYEKHENQVLFYA